MLLWRLIPAPQTYLRKGADSPRLRNENFQHFSFRNVPISEGPTAAQPLDSCILTPQHAGF